MREERLARRLKNADGHSARIDVLQAISNSGDERLLGAVRPFLDAPGGDIRGTAVLALRHMQTTEVPGLMAAALKKEKSKRAQLTILAAMKTWGRSDECRAVIKELLEKKSLDQAVSREAVALYQGWSR